MPPRQPLQPSPLTTWGCFSGHRRASDSPYIESVWTGIASRNGVHLTAADGTIDLAFRKRQGVTRLLLSGPTSKAHAATFEAGDEVLAVRLRTGVHLTYVDAAALLDVDTILPNAGSKRAWLYSHAVPRPDFNTVEAFVGRLVRAGLLHRDVIVEDALADKAARVGLRTIQRHFIAATGLTPGHIRQIRRAEKARSLLSGDSTLTSIAYETGYSNSGHMTNAFKYFFGLAPSTLRTLMTQDNSESDATLRALR